MENPYTAKMEDTKPLIQQILESGEFTPIDDSGLRTYYTCARVHHTALFTASYSGPMATRLTYYGTGQWSCTKGWFESYDGTFQGKKVDSKVLNYSKFNLNHEFKIQKELGEEFIMFHPKPKASAPNTFKG